MKQKIFTIANLLTGGRIVCSLILPLFGLSSVAFWIFYFLAGVTDMVDGTVARKTHTESKFGAALDTAADFIFFFISSILILPTMDFPIFIWIWIAVIFLLKMIPFCIGVCKCVSIQTVHNQWNRICGLLLFAFPLVCRFLNPLLCAVVLCFYATGAAIAELIAQKKYFFQKGVEVSKTLAIMNLSSA